MKICTVCGLGMGSSLIMKMTVEQALDKLNIESSIEHWDAGTVNPTAYDLVITTPSFKDNFQEHDNIIYIDNIVDTSEVKNKIEKFIN